jgi:hypothetical protein
VSGNAVLTQDAEMAGQILSRALSFIAFSRCTCMFAATAREENVGEARRDPITRSKLASA